MIPPGFSAKTPLGEKELFNKLRDDPDTQGWIVLHSLDIKKHQSKIEGELDMVILVPGMGVLCVEVKGCDVERKHGKWIYPYETSVEGPFKQASTAMHSLRDYLVKRDCSLSGLLFFSAAIFTRANFSSESPEWHPWQYINALMFRRRPISASVTDILERAHDHIRSRTSRYSWYKDSDSRPTEAQIRRISSLLRDDFEYLVSSRSDKDQIEESIRHFTEEQFDALDLLQENDRIMFKGPAGTGKTFLAMEAARRAALEGKSVLFLCYNNLLGDWLKDKTSGLARDRTQFICGTFHSLLLDVSGEKSAMGTGRDYWQKELPRKAADRLLDDDRTYSSYDMLIIDEAQDLLTEEYLDILDLLLTGGLAGGKWALFGDFERQAIYVAEGGPGVLAGLQSLAGRAPNHVNFGLRINCRNAEPIADLLTITSGLVPGYKGVLQDLEGSDIDPLFYGSPTSQSERLREAISALGETFNAKEIVIISMRGDEDSCAGTSVNGFIGVRVAPIRKAHDSQTIPYASIHAFKGLEAQAVIITDIESLDDERSRSLLYVGMSRARIRLYMLMHESCRQSYDRILDSGLERISRR